MLLNSTTGAFSDWHCDAAGALSLVRILTGQKLWVIETKRRDDQHPAARNINALLLGPGDVLWVPLVFSLSFLVMRSIPRILRPGVKHSVYTIQISMATGSHFYFLGILEESLYTRFREAAFAQETTNACLPIGHALVVYYGLALTEPDFDPAYYGISGFCVYPPV